MWFADYGQEPNVKVLARIIGDLRCRYEVWKPSGFSAKFLGSSRSNPVGSRISSSLLC